MTAARRLLRAGVKRVCFRVEFGLEAGGARAGFGPGLSSVWVRLLGVVWFHLFAAARSSEDLQAERTAQEL